MGRGGGGGGTPPPFSTTPTPTTSIYLIDPLPYLLFSARAEHLILWNTDDQLFPQTAFTR